METQTIEQIRIKEQIDEAQWMLRYRKDTIEKANAACAKLTAAGIKFTRSQHWASYITLHTPRGNFMCFAIRAEYYLDRAMKEYQKSGYIDLTSIIKYFCKYENKPVIELCANDDWFENCSIYNRGKEDDNGYHIQRDRISRAREQITFVFNDAYFAFTHGNNFTHDDWDRAHFVHRNSIAGTFDVLTDIGIKKFEAI